MNDMSLSGINSPIKTDRYTGERQRGHMHTEKSLQIVSAETCGDGWAIRPGPSPPAPRVGATEVPAQQSPQLPAPQGTLGHLPPNQPKPKAQAIFRKKAHFFLKAAHF